MNRRTVGIVLLIVGILIFVYATSQISNLPSPMFTPAALQDSLINEPQGTYRVFQVVSALAAVVGGVLIFQKG